MVQLVSDVDGDLLDRVDLVASRLGTDRSQVVERALRHYLRHADDVKLENPHHETGSTTTAVDWAEVKSTLVASRCPYPSCPHSGDCPIEICPL